MKKLLYVALILLGIGIVSSCNKFESQDGLVGTWKIVYSEETFYAPVGEVWTFEKGGTLVIDGYPMYQYRYDPQTKTCKYAASGEFLVVSITSSKMRISFDLEGREAFVVFQKVN